MKHLAILVVEAYSINENEIYEIRQEHKRYPFEQLPPFTINLKEYNDKANNDIRYADDYLQFVGQIKDDNPNEYVLFDLATHDNVLGEEVSSVGYDDLFKGIDFKKILSNFKIEKYKDKWKTLKAPFHLIVEMEYIGGYDHYSGATEYDLDIDIIGYLDSSLEKVIFDVLNIEK